MVVTAEVVIDLGVITSALISQKLVADVILDDAITVQKIRRV